MNAIEHATATSRSTTTGEIPCEELLSALDAERPRLRRWLGRWLGSDEDAEDAIQEAMIAAWRKAEELQRTDSPQAWLSRCAHNAAASMLRRRTARGRRETVWGADKPVAGPEPGEMDETGPTVALLEEALAVLPRPSAELISGVYLRGQSIAEIADLERRTRNAVRVRLHRARQDLRRTATAILLARETASRPSTRAAMRESGAKYLRGACNPRPSAASSGRRA